MHAQTLSGPPCMQVLESTVFSAILAAADRRTVEAGRLLEVGASRRMTDYEQRTEGVQGWRDVQWLRRMKEWAIFAFVACPGMFAFTTLNTPNYQPDWGGWAPGGGGVPATDVPGVREDSVRWCNIAVLGSIPSTLKANQESGRIRDLENGCFRSEENSSCHNFQPPTSGLKNDYTLGL